MHSSAELFNKQTRQLLGPCCLGYIKCSNAPAATTNEHGYCHGGSLLFNLSALIRDLLQIANDSAEKGFEIVRKCCRGNATSKRTPITRVHCPEACREGLKLQKNNPHIASLISNKKLDYTNTLSMGCLLHVLARLQIIFMP